MTGYLKEMRASGGDGLEISKDDDAATYRIRIVRAVVEKPLPDEGPLRIKITSAWRRVH